MRRVPIICLVILIPGCILLYTCAGSRRPPKKEQREIPGAGKVHKQIACLSDPDISYALYLPAATATPVKEKTKTWPVIIAFDPHASGSLPVTKYKDLADKYGFILLGSNNSKNGLTQPEYEAVLKALLYEIRSAYPIDTSRIYLMGFSGGSRVAALLAMFHREIRGVIGCGAGFPGGGQNPAFRFDYFGIVGTGDFNLTEMLQLDSALKEAGARHFVTKFNGPHEWPPANIMEDAFRWTGFNAMKDRMIPLDQEAIDTFRKVKETETGWLEKQNRLAGAASQLELLISCLEGLFPTGNYTSRLRNLQNTPGYQQQAKAFGSSLIREQEEQQMLIQSLNTRNISWWKKQIRNYQSGSGKGTSTDDSLMNRRILSFLGLFLYGNANAAMNRDDREASGKMILLYGMAEPANPEPNYLSALLLMRQNDTTASMAQLQEAIDKGFSDKARIIRQDEFKGLGMYRPYLDLLQKMKTP